MKYLCMMYYDEANVNALSQSEFDALVDRSLGYTEDLKKTGHYVAADGLQPVATATTLRLHNGKLSITDGPFAETKEQLGGFYIIEAADMDEAIRLASGMPPLQLGCVEIRPLRELKSTDETLTAWEE